MKVMQKIAILSIFVLGFLVFSASGVFAGEATLSIDIGYFANYTENPDFPADMGSGIYGSKLGSILFGNHHAMIPLTLDAVPINEEALEDHEYDVPGIHIFRGVDSNGSYFEITSYGENTNLTRESVKFSISLENAEIINIVNGPRGNWRYERPESAGCGIIENPERNAQNDDALNDEYAILSDTEAEFCSVTGGGSDRVRIYYENHATIDPLSITNVNTNPSFPIVNYGNSQIIRVSFESNRYPLKATFNLFDSNGNKVNSLGPLSIDSETQIPLTYNLPAGLSDGIYILKLEIKDLFGNIVNLELGQIEVKKIGGGNKKKERGTLETYNPSTQNNYTVSSFVEEEVISLGVSNVEKKFEISIAMWILIVMIILAIILIFILLII